ncbi:omptin family outer membrane protease [Salmonella enterica]|nr:omptin family outer membrane protease [Salmonella enterica]ELV2721377.1 omptin family outer membrane protease [Salmonella enterica]
MELDEDSKDGTHESRRTDTGLCTGLWSGLERNRGLNGTLSVGFLDGEASEWVYEPDEGGRKVSQLNLMFF